MRQLLVLFVLLLLMQVTARLEPALGQPFDSLTLLTAGFILIGAYTMGELFRRMRLPALLGYLAAGIVFGPKLIGLVFGETVSAPIGSEAIHDLALINVLAVGVIGTMGGGEIKLPELRENFGKLVAICGAVFIVVLPSIVALVLGLTFVAPQLIPFLAELPLAGRIAGAALFGALAVGMSPAATLALLQEVRARGRFTSLVLGVVVLGDLILVATFLMILALAKLLVSPEGLTLDSMVAQLPAIAAEFGWALAIGVIVGAIYILYLQFVRREILLFSLAVVFVTSFVCARLHAETLLAFLIAGFVVQNLSRHGHTLVEAFERISLPVFVIYFTTQAAALDLVAVTAYLPLTLLLVGARVGLFWLSIGVGARWAGADAPTRSRLQVSFFSQGGVDLVLAAMIADALPGWGQQVQLVTIATVLFYVVGGPWFLARSLDAAGESEAARERGAEDLASRASNQIARKREPIDTPMIEAPHHEPGRLGQRLAELHAFVVRLREQLIDGEILARARRRRAVVEQLAGELDTAWLELGDAPDLPTLATQRIAAIDDAMAAVGREHAHATLEPFDGRTLMQLFRELDAAQRFDESHRVTMTDALFEPRGGRMVSSLRALRRLRRAAVGPGQRTVPLGRLWRYHVTLDLPVALWSNVRPSEARLWHMLLEHYRVTRRLLDALAQGDWSTVELNDPTEHDAAGHDAHGHDVAGHDAHGHDAHDDVQLEAPPAPSLDEWLTQARTHASARTHEIRERLTEIDGELERGLMHGLAHAWSSFLDSVELAGTLEYPAWRHRPSSRHDVARAATAELLERSAGDRERAAGRFDAILALAHAQRVARVARTEALEFERNFAGALGELHGDFDGSLTLAAALASEAPTREEGEQLGASLLRMGRHVELLRRELADVALREPQLLRQTLQDTPESLAPSTELSSGPDSELGDARRSSIPLRAWLSQTLVREYGITRAAASEELGAGLVSLRLVLAQIGQVVEYNLGADAFGSGPLADAGLVARVTDLLERARGQVDELGRLARTHVDEQVARAEQVSLAPIVAHRWSEILRRSRQLDSRSEAVNEWLRERLYALQRRWVRARRALADELAAVFAARPSSAAIAAWRQLLLGPRSDMPEAYQRLFTSVPAETVGLLIPRTELTTLERRVDRWLDGLGGPILIHGERGAGKRTLVRQLSASRGDRLGVRWLRLSTALDREADVVLELARSLELIRHADDHGPHSFAELGQRIRTHTSVPWRATTRDGETSRRVAIVVENGDRLFRRSVNGLDDARNFLALVAATSEQLLWIVLMAEPAVPVLDAALELRARFPEPIHVPGMSAGELEQVLDLRHRLSGYHLQLVPGEPDLATWLRRPGEAWRVWRRRPGVVFEQLARLSEGNVRQALRLWLAVARVDPSSAAMVVLGPLPAEPCPLLDQLPLSSRVLLAALMLHGPLPRSDLLTIHGQHALDLDAELAQLAHLELIVFDDGNGDDDRVVFVGSRLVQPLTAELRACNLL